MIIQINWDNLTSNYNTIDNCFCQPCTGTVQLDCGNRSGNLTRCGSGWRVQPPKRIPILNSSPTPLSIASASVFFFKVAHSLNEGGDLYGKVMRSVSPYVVPWVSHHQMIAVVKRRMLAGPLLAICCSWRFQRDIWEIATRHSVQT